MKHVSNKLIAEELIARDELHGNPSDPDKWSGYDISEAYGRVRERIGNELPDAPERSRGVSYGISDKRCWKVVEVAKRIIENKS